MNKLIQAISDTVRTSLGQPVYVERFLAAHPHFNAGLRRPGDNIAMASVPKWQTLGQWGSREDVRQAGRTALMGWRREGTAYRSFGGTCPSLSNLVKKVVVDTWRCDLQDVHGFAASKSKLETFSSMDQMVETNSREMIEDVSLAGLRKNLAHKEIRVTGENPGSDWLQVHQWDGRMFVANDGGSHHLAAAKYIAARIAEPVTLTAPLHYYAMDPGAVAALRAEYDIFIVNHHYSVQQPFFAAAESSGVTWLWHELPAPYAGARALFLPRGEPLSMKASQAFKEAGFEELGAHMAELAALDIPEVIRKHLPSTDMDDDAESHSDDESGSFGRSG